MEGIGTVVDIVDELGVPHKALVTAIHGTLGVSAINVVYVGKDPAKRDPYGHQLERLSSLAVQNEHAAHGRYYTVPK